MKRGSLGKRGMDDSQFHWLFVLLAGGFILFMFALFIGQGIAANQQKQTALLLRYFDGVLSSSQNVQNLNKPVESLASLTIQQDCEPGGSSRLMFVEQSLSKDIPTIALYSAHRISGETYALKTLPYDAPFRVDNPIYLTDSRTLYVVFTADEAVGQRYLDLLPASASKLVTDDLGSITLAGFRDIVLITENNGQMDSVTLSRLPAILRGANIRHIDIQTDARSATYYFKDTLQGQAVLRLRSEERSDPSITDSVTFTDEATLLGALMSDDPSIYQCNVEKLQKRARAVAVQIALRANELATVRDMDGRCVASYGDASSMLLQGAADASMAMMSDKTGWQDPLAAENDALIKYSCPSLY